MVVDLSVLQRLKGNVRLIKDKDNKDREALNRPVREQGDLLLLELLLAKEDQQGLINLWARHHLRRRSGQIITDLRKK